MRDLTVRLSALDPDAGAALRVVSYFDELAAGHAGLHAIVRGATSLTGSPAGFLDARRHLRLRVNSAGENEPGEDDVADGSSGPDPAWLSAAVDDVAVLWLERSGPPRVVDAVVLERACALARSVLERTRPLAASASRRQDADLLEVVLDPRTPRDDRRRAARSLGLAPETPCRAVAVVDGTALVLTGPVEPPLGSRRAGVGPVVTVDELPGSWVAARRALRLTAEGTATDPGPRIVHAEAVQGLLLLAAAVPAGATPVPDVGAVERAAVLAPWMLRTLDVLATTSSRRAAATELAVHHSTVQARVLTAQRALGWELQDVAGLQRLQLALVLRRLHRNS